MNTTPTSRRLIFFGLAFFLMTGLVLLISWALDLINTPRDLALAFGPAVIGVATILGLFVAILEASQKAPAASPASPLAGAQDLLPPSSPAPLPPALHQLEPPPADFTGREEELEELRRAIETDGALLCGLFGMGGVGKTTLALKLAEMLTPRFPHAQLYLDLGGANPEPLTSAEAITHLVHAFLPREELPEGEQLLTLYRSMLHGRRVLLLMDDARDAEQVKDLIPPSGSILLVTSRFRFTLPGLKSIDLDKLPAEDARSLVLAIAPRLGEATGDPAGELCRLCDYLPLALRVSASALQVRRNLPPADYLRQLSDLGRRLQLAGVEASLRLSYDLLPNELKGRWAALSVFAASFDGEAAAAVWELQLEPVQEALGDLLAFSLLEFNPATQRYELHDLARLLAGGLLDEDQCFASQSRHAAHFLHVLGTAKGLYGQGGDAILTGLRLFDLEWENIQAGQAWAAANAAQDRQAASLCNDYADVAAHLLLIRLPARQRIAWLEPALSAARQLGDQAMEAAHLGNLGNAYDALGDSHQAIEYYGQALALARETGDRGDEEIQLGNLANAYAYLGHARRAIDYYEQAVAIVRETGDRRGEAIELGNLGTVYYDLGEPQRAIEHYELALAISRELGDRRSEGFQLGNIGEAYKDLGQMQRAIENLELALTISREIGDRRSEAFWLGYLGGAYVAVGEPRRAITYCEQALAISREIDDRRNEAIWLGYLGRAYAALDEPRQTFKYCEQALAISREIGDRRNEGYLLDSLGLAHQSLGSFGPAIDSHKQAIAILGEIGEQRGLAEASWNLGLAYERSGDLASAVHAMQLRVDYEQRVSHPGVAEHAAQVAELRSRLNQ